MAGLQVAAAAQTTSTTTGTGAFTIANTVPASAPAGSTTFAAAFAPLGVFPVPNVFYYAADALGNIEVGFGTLTSATVLSRDFVLVSGTTGLSTSFAVPAGSIANTQILETVTATHQAFAAGTLNIYSNPAVHAFSAAWWARYPNILFSGDSGFTEDEMSGTFTGLLTTGATTVNCVIRYKVSSAGLCRLQFPATTVTGAGTNLTITGIPSFLSNVTTGSFFIAVVVNGVNTIGIASIAVGATPTATGTMTLSQYSGVAPFAQTATWTTSQANGVQAGSAGYDLF